MERPDIRTIWEHYGGNLRESGGNQSTRCVVHEDKYPSASVNVDEGVFFCFACGASGDSYKLIEMKEGLSGFAAVVQRAEAITGRSLSGVSRATGPTRTGLSGKSFTPQYRRRGPAWGGALAKGGS